MAQKCGTRLVCLKKASRYAEWASQLSRPPFALIVEWREAKSCMQLVPRDGAMPFITFVYSETPRTTHRARDWASTLGADLGQVHVLDSILHLEPMLLRATKAMQGESLCQVPRVDLSSACQEALTQKFADGDGQKFDAGTDEIIAHQGYNFEADGQKFNVCTRANTPQCRGFEGIAGTGWNIFAPVMEPTVIDFLTFQCSTQHGWYLIEELLVSSMPDHYKD